MSKYNRTIIGINPETMAPVVVVVDVYRVLDAFHVTDSALQHLVKKALCAGLRGHKDLAQDLNEILVSAQKAVHLNDDKHELERKNG